MGAFLKAVPLVYANIPLDVIKILNKIAAEFLFFKIFTFALHSLKKQVCKYHFLKGRMFTIA